MFFRDLFFFIRAMKYTREDFTSYIFVICSTLQSQQLSGPCYTIKCIIIIPFYFCLKKLSHVKDKIPFNNILRGIWILCTFLQNFAEVLERYIIHPPPFINMQFYCCHTSLLMNDEYVLCVWYVLLLTKSYLASYAIEYNAIYYNMSRAIEHCVWKPWKLKERRWLSRILSIYQLPY